VPWSRKARAIPLIPLWAVRPVHSLRACIRVHFNEMFGGVVGRLLGFPEEIIFLSSSQIDSKDLYELILAV
jgi:hypothetical protein